MELEVSLPHSQVPATCPDPEPAQISPYPTSHFLKIHLNIILPTTLSSPSDLFPSGFPTNTLHTSFFSHIVSTCPAHLILDVITRTILSKEYRSLSSTLCNFLHSPVTSSLLDPNILLSILFWNTLNLSSTLKVSDQVTHPYKRTGKFIFLNVSFFKYITYNTMP